MFSKLTKRETEVARLLAVGISNRVIAEQLGVSIKTVDTHRMHIMKKLDVRNNVELARLAIGVGFVPVPHAEAA